MACVQRSGEFVPYQTDISFYRLIKLRTGKECQICRKNLTKGTYCLKGWGWSSGVCLDCAEEVLKNGVNSVEDFHKKMVEFQDDFKIRVKELKEKNMVNVI